MSSNNKQEKNFDVKCISKNFDEFVAIYQPVIDGKPISDEFKETYLKLSNFKSEYLPSYLKTPVKLKLFKQAKYLDRDLLIKLFKHQSFGKDFAAFGYLADIGILPRNDDGIVTIKQSKFGKEGYKKEAYFIYLLLESLKRNKIIKYFWDQLQIDVQSSLEDKIQGIGRKRSKHMDIQFLCKLMPDFKLIVEIDEHGHENTNNNDAFKSALARVYGDALIRIDAANAELLSYAYGNIEKCDYWNDLIADVSNLIVGMLFRPKILRQKGVKLMFEQHIIQKMEGCLESARIHTDPDVKQGLLETGRTYKRLLMDLNNDLVVSLFSLKNQSNQDERTIALDTVYALFPVEKENQPEFRKSLLKQNMVTNECICWLDLSTIINTSIPDSGAREVLFQYFKTTEFLYENMIKKWQFYDQIVKHGFQCECVDPQSDFDMVFNECRESQDKEIKDMKSKLKANKSMIEALKAKCEKMESLEQENTRLKVIEKEYMELASNQETINLHYRTLNHMLNNDDNPFRQIKKYIGLISALFKPSISANEKFKQKINHLLDTVTRTEEYLQVYATQILQVPVSDDEDSDCIQNAIEKFNLEYEKLSSD